MLAAPLPRLATTLLQPPVLAAGLATGIITGAIGVGTGAVPVSDPGPRLTALYECPGSGRVVANRTADQKVLVTGRSADGSWLEIYIGEPVAERGWAPVTALQLPASPELLPISDCAPEPTPAPTPAPLTAPPTIAPTAVPTEPPTPAPTATPKPTAKPTKRPTPKPTAPTGPSLTGLLISYPLTADPQTGHYFIRRPIASCSDITQATIGVTANDPDGVVSVTLYYQLENAGVSNVAMYEEDPELGLWQADLFAQDDWSHGVIEYWVQATDGVGDKSPLKHGTSEYILELYGCD